MGWFCCYGNKAHNSSRFVYRYLNILSFAQLEILPNKPLQQSFHGSIQSISSVWVIQKRWDTHYSLSNSQNNAVTLSKPDQKWHLAYLWYTYGFEKLCAYAKTGEKYGEKEKLDFIILLFVNGKDINVKQCRKTTKMQCMTMK